MSIPETSFAAAPPTAAERAAVRALAGLELGVLGALLTEGLFIFSALIAGWGRPSFAAIALHVVIYALTGVMIAVFARRARSWLTLAAAGVIVSFFLRWLVERFVWVWLRRLNPEQAPDWAYLIAAIVLGLVFALVPARARSFEREFLLK